MKRQQNNDNTNTNKANNLHNIINNNHHNNYKQSNVYTRISKYIINKKIFTTKNIIFATTTILSISSVIGYLYIINKSNLTSVNNNNNNNNKMNSISISNNKRQ